MLSLQLINQYSKGLLPVCCAASIFGLLCFTQNALAVNESQKTPNPHPEIIKPHIKVELPEREDGAIRVTAKNATLDRILTTLTDKTGVKIHYSGLPSATITATCRGESVKNAVECLLGPGASLAAKLPEQNGKSNSKTLAAELWILSAPNIASRPRPCQNV